MKKFKKLTSLVLAFAMVFAMSMTALAAEADLSGHVFKAYQIFSGSQTDDTDDATLARVEWGTGVNSSALLTAVKADATIGADFTDCSTAADVAAVLANYTDKSDEAEAFAKLAYANKTGSGAEIGDTLAAGYYLVVDETVFAGGAENTVKNLALLQLTKKEAFEIENKTDVPEMVKKVDDENDSVMGDGGEDSAVWNDSADYDIGDEVPFKLTGTVADNYDDYAQYYFAFHDVEETGLTFLPNTVVVKVDGVTITKGYEVVTDCEDGCTFEVVFENLKTVAAAKAGSEITVEYKSTLNTAAKIGDEGNVNKARLEYSNNPNAVQSGSGKPEDTGFTPWDNVIVFTYQVNITKTDGTDKLTGAKFELYKWIATGSGEEDGDWSLVKAYTGGTESVFGFTGLDDGTYKLVETEAPAGYNKVADITFTVTASHNIVWEAGERNDVLVSLTGNKVTGEITFTADKEEGSLNANVVNNKGTVLPETGGMGTTLFYVIGSILVLGAAVALITKKRMSK